MRGKLFGAGGWVLAGVVLLAGAGVTTTAPGTLRVRRLEVVDGKGRVRMNLLADESGPMIGLLAADGSPRLTLALDGEDARVMFARPESRGLTAISIKVEGGEPRVNLLRRRGGKLELTSFPAD